MLGCIQPMSSPMMNMMLGLPFGGCASADTADASIATASSEYRDFRDFILRLHGTQLTRWAPAPSCPLGATPTGSTHPKSTDPIVRGALDLGRRSGKGALDRV